MRSAPSARSARRPSRGARAGRPNRANADRVRHAAPLAGHRLRRARCGAVRSAKRWRGSGSARPWPSVRRPCRGLCSSARVRARAPAKRRRRVARIPAGRLRRGIRERIERMKRAFDHLAVEPRRDHHDSGTPVLVGPSVQVSGRVNEVLDAIDQHRAGNPGHVQQPLHPQHAIAVTVAAASTSTLRTRSSRAPHRR